MSHARDVVLFSPRVGRWLLWGASVAVGVTLFFLVFGEAPDEIRSARADAFSYSAIGYRALIELLEDEVPVVVSRHRSEEKAGPRVPLLLFEPPFEALDRLQALLSGAARRGATVVIVPSKWRSREDPARRGWLRSVTLLSPGEVRVVIGSPLAPGLKALTRPAAVDRWRRGGEPPLPAPTLDRPQLLIHSRLAPAIEAEEGVLVGRLAADATRPEMLVVADPDLFNNAGLGRGENATLARRLLVESLDAEALVFDAEIHGHGRPPSPWRALLRFPLALLTLHLFFFLLLAQWAAGGRFGRPLPAPRRLLPGKETLIDNTARLLAVGDRGHGALERYFAASVRRVATRLGLAPDPDPRRQAARLIRRGGAGTRLEPLVRAVYDPATRDPWRVLAVANAIHRWRKETIDGPRADPRAR